MKDVRPQIKIFKCATCKKSLRRNEPDEPIETANSMITEKVVFKLVWLFCGQLCLDTFNARYLQNQHATSYDVKKACAEGYPIERLDDIRLALFRIGDIKK